MLCEVSDYFFGGSFLGIWAMMNVFMLTSILVSSSAVFYYYYWPSMVTYDKWRYKVGTALYVREFERLL